MFDRRLQVLIDDERWDRLEREAERRKVSVSALVRDAIDERYPSDAQERYRAAQALLDAEPMPVPETVEELRKELDEMHKPHLA